MPVHGYALSEPRAHCDLPRNGWSTVPPAPRVPAALHRNDNLISRFSLQHIASWRFPAGRFGSLTGFGPAGSSQRDDEFSPRRRCITAPNARRDRRTPVVPGQTATRRGRPSRDRGGRAARSRRLIESPSARAPPSRVLVARHPSVCLRRLGRPRGRRHRRMNTSLACEAASATPCTPALIAIRW